MWIMKYLNKYKYWIMLFLVFLVINFTIGDMMDDATNIEAMDHFGGFFKWLYANATMWSGRLVPAAIFELLLQLPSQVFAVLNTLFCLLLIYSANKTFCGSELNNSYIPLIEGILILVLLPADVCKYALWWKSASIFYLWGTAMSMLMLYPFVAEAKGTKVKPSEWVLCGLGIFYATSFEQIAAFDMVFAIFMALWNKIVLKRKGFVTPVIALLISALSIAFLKMPGNSIRTMSETILHLPHFGMFTTDQKVLLGSIYTLDMYTLNIPGVMLGIAGITCYLICKSKSQIYVKIVSCIVALYYLGAFIERYICTKTSHIKQIWLLDELYNYFNFDSPTFFYDKALQWHVIIALAMFAILGFLIFLALSSEKRLAVEIPLLFFGGAGCTLIIGFSPTIYGSGDRVKFIGIIFTIFVFFTLIKEFIRRSKLHLVYD